MGTKKKQRILAAITSILLVAVVVLGVVVNDAESKFITIEDLLTPLAGGPVLVQQTDADINVIPDKYNTGCKGELTKVTGATTINNVYFKCSSNTISLDFAYANRGKEGTFVFENLDFSDYTFAVYNESEVKSGKIDLIFDNCRFGMISNAYPKSNVFSYTFNDCSIYGFGGSNAIFNYCKFGGTYNDGINPFQNIRVNSCYFSDLSSTNSAGKGAHSDGVQIFGNAKAPAEDVLFDNCRFEIPSVQNTGNTNAINSCVFIGLEYSNAKNIHFTNCLVNGGGYTLYANANSPYTLSDVSFDSVKVGYAKLFGTLFPKVADGVVLNNVVDQDSLYVSSVWKENGKTHIIVSNDTGIDRTLKVITESNEYTYTIGKCLGGNELRYASYATPFSDFPFDMDIVVPEDASHVICYDATNGTESQIRFVNWSGEQVYVGGVIKDDKPEEKNKPNKKNKNDKKTSRNDAKKPVLTTGNEVEDTTPEEIVETVSDVPEPLSGTCGEGVSFILSSEGVLTISGQGAMDNYHGGKLPPWYNRMQDITQVVFDEGITSVGSQSLKNAQNLEQVTFPSSLVSICSNSFLGCSKLQEIIIGKNITFIGEYALCGSGITRAFYEGSESEWNNIKIEAHNDPLVNCVIFMQEQSTDGNESDEPAGDSEKEEILLEGSCGGNASFSLTESGVLYIFGEGGMDNFHGGKPSPWSEYVQNIKKVEIADGITTIGAQSFKNAQSLEEIEIPLTVGYIGSNSFIGCGKLCSIYLGENISFIGQYAFSGSGLSYVYYEGTEDEWKNVCVEDHNDPLVKNLHYIE